MTNELLHRIMSTAEQLDGPEAWVHLCITAADEARSVETEGIYLRKPSEIEQAVRNVRNKHTFENFANWEIGYLVELGELYVKGHIGGRSSEPGTDAASIAYRTTLPHITNRRSVQCFVACVAAGVLRGHIDVKDANALLYAAQAALSAFPKRKSRAAK